MQRIYAPVDDPTLDRIDQDVKEKDISRAQWVNIAIDTYLTLSGENGGADPSKLQQEMMQLRTDNDRPWKELQDLKKAEKDARLDGEQLRSEISAIQEQMQKAQWNSNQHAQMQQFCNMNWGITKIQSIKRIRRYRSYKAMLAS